VTGAAALVLYGKLPIPGQVKTRLAPRLGNRGAAALAEAFLRDAAEAYAELDGIVPVVAAGPDPSNSFWPTTFPAPWRIEPQGDGDLGERLRRAFRREFRSFPRVMAVGADHPSLPLDRLARFAAESDAVWPARDGGYAAILLSRSPRALELFDEIPWSTARVLDETAARARRAGISLTLYPETYDVDEPPDLDRLRRDLRERDRRAPGFPRHSWEALSRFDPAECRG